MDISKLNKTILFALLSFFFISSIIAFVINILDNPYIDQAKIKECENSKFVAYNDRIIIEFVGYNVEEIERFSIHVKRKGNLNKEIKYSKLDSNDLTYYFNTKILKTDTLFVKLKNKEFKIYDFKNEGRRQKAGEDRGTYYCDISALTINSKIDSLHATNRIVLSKNY